MLPTDKKLILISAAIAAIMLVIGAIIFFKDIVYYEREQLYYMMAYAVLTIGLFLSTSKLRFLPMGLVSVLMIGLLVFSSLKYDWRKDFINAHDYGQKAILLDRIDRFPTYEAHLIALAKKQPNWVGFANDCIKPALSNQVMNRNCLTTNLIQASYGIDLDNEITQQHQRMKYTVQQIERGRLKSKRQYIGCIASKRCAAVPLLPQGVKAGDIDPRSDDHLSVRQLFWEIASGRELSREVCAINALCAAALKGDMIKVKSSADIAAEESQRTTTSF